MQVTQNNSKDVIIAGSGLGGLVCGYILAKNGYSVSIFEKNAQIGGCLQTFTRKGVRFDTGMHYIPAMDKGQFMNHVFEYLQLTEDVPVVALDREGFDVIVIGDETFRFANGTDNFVNKLAGQFPNNRTEIENYIRTIQKYSELSFIFNKNNNINNASVSLKDEMFATSFNDFIARFTDNKKLRAVLAGNTFLYAGENDKTSLYTSVQVNNFYMQSAYRIVGGADLIAHSLAKSIKKMGGNIHTQSEVMEFVCNHQKMTEIQLNNGERYKAKYFISNIHPQVTINKIKSPLIRNIYRKRIGELENTISNFTLYIIFKKNRVKYNNYNYHFFENQQLVGLPYYNPENFPSSYLYVHQAPKYDTEFADAAKVITDMPFDAVRQWENTYTGCRGNDYEEFKKICAKKIIDKLEKQFTGIKECISDYYTSSPLTYRDYTATVNGATYGILKDKNRPLYSAISHKTKIPNFFLTGQSINSHGMIGVIANAIVTASELVHKEKIIADILNS